MAEFLSGIEPLAPPLAVISAVSSEQIPLVEEGGFIVRESGGGGGEVQISPDCDVCPDCLGELFDPADRRYRYPFINCTNCGPRYTIIKGVPYDRAATTMAGFTMCEECLAEYGDPGNRRFHAQPNACPVCGPRLTLLDPKGKSLEGDPLDTAISMLQRGRILALKGVGGYHLAVDACNDDAVRELRRRKNRDEKPFALISPGLAEIMEYARFDETEQRLLSGAERPIVLLRKRERNPIVSLVAPANGYFGVMLPCTPLHHLLLRDNFLALVMTSGNLSDEPVSFLDDEALQRLAGIADLFLTHNRDIHTRTDDSVIRVFQGKPIFLRRSRGYVPRGITLPSVQRSVLAVGGELKGTVCLTRGNLAFLSQHIGDLRNAATLRSMEETIVQLGRILRIDPKVVAHDLHPDYLSTVHALSLPGLTKVAVQHHHAHLASCMAENGLEGETIGVIFDGTGYGPDGTVWGGEFLVGGYGSYRRAGHLRPIPLPGGDAAVRAPFRMALSWLYMIYGELLFALPLPPVSELPASERKLFMRMLERRLNSPLTSSCGRLFDAVASIIGLRQKVSYEGQAAIELEALAESTVNADVYPFGITLDGGVQILDFCEMVQAIVQDVVTARPEGEIARSFHNTMAEAVVETCRKIRTESGIDRVVLSGGVFQNKLLTEGVFTLLVKSGFYPFTQRLVPPNDGGVALGQAIIAGRSVLCV